MKQPTTEQLNDPAWWDANAPEGATHFARFPSGETEWQKRLPNKVSQVWSERLMLWEDLGPHSKATMTLRPIRPPAPEWEGKGRPPVNTKCLARHVHQWKSGTVIWHREGNDVDALVLCEDGYTTFWAYDFYRRPTESAEAERLAQRLEAILHQAEDEVSDPTPDDSPSARIGELGNQVHNLSCELQNDEALADELGKVAATLWDLSKAATKQRERDAERAELKAIIDDFLDSYEWDVVLPGNLADLIIARGWRKGGE